MTSKTLNRRSFLRGSSLFAAALGLNVLPAAAQQSPQQPAPQAKPEEKKKEEEKKVEDPFADGEKPEKSKDGKLYDKEGREYRICPQCGYNMYKQGKMWICENCGYSYVE
jgi:rubrerythrin